MFKGNLWRQRDFLKFWTSDTVTQFTGQISGLALPTVAVLTLQVTGFQLGVLNALGFIAFPIFGLFVGVWMDRIKRKPVMIVANLVQVAALASVPAAFLIGILGLYQLYLVSFIMGATTLFYDVAFQSYFPSLVNKGEVVEGNQKLQTSESAATVVGPVVASAIMQLIGAALAVAADAIGTLVSAFLLASIREPEPNPSSADGRRDFFAEMKEGIKTITGNKLLWTIAGTTGTSNFGTNIFGVALLLYAYRVLGISKGLIGVTFSLGAVGFFVGVLITSAMTRKLGMGRALALSAAAPFVLLLVLLANNSFSVLILGGTFFLGYLGQPIYNINQVSLRQIITPNRLQGRMNATMRTIVWGTIPAGSLLEGIFVTSFGITQTLVIGSLIAGSSFLWIVLGPVFKLVTQPAAVVD